MLHTRKILVLGHARHGKDTVAEHLRDVYGLQYRGSSEICAPIVRDALAKDYDVFYGSVEACFEDRVNHRGKWHDIIKKYNEGDSARLAKLIFSQADIYCGLRDSAELNAVVAEFDPLIIWVTAGDRAPLESSDSINITNSNDYYTIWNTKDFKHLWMQIASFVDSHLLGKWEDRFSELAECIAYWSKDPECRVGAIAVAPDGRTMSPGYNGFPKNLADDERLTDTEKNNLVLHAEVNAILNAKQSVEGWHLFTTKHPCLQCALTLIQAGIVCVVCPVIDGSSSWASDNAAAKAVLNEAGVRLLTNPRLN